MSGGRLRRAKTDRIDVGKVLRALIAWLRGGRHVGSGVRIPSVGEEDLPRSHRERDYLVHERTAHLNRIKGLLFAQGIRGINLKRRIGPHPPAISRLGASRTPAVGARGCRRHSGVRETYTKAAVSCRSKLALIRS